MQTTLFDMSAVTKKRANVKAPVVEKQRLPFVLQWNIWCYSCKKRGAGSCSRCASHSKDFYTLHDVAVFILGNSRLWTEALVMATKPSGIVAGGFAADIVQWANKQEDVQTK